MKMLRLALAALAVLTVAVAAQPVGAGDLGVGLMAGQPSGLSAKLWRGPRTAFDGGLAWAWHEDEALHVHLDFLYHLSTLMPESEPGALLPYVGLGGRVHFGKKSRIGARVPLGITMLFEEFPFDVFFEVVPVVDLIPDTKPDWNGAIGFRYYFR